MTTCPAFHDRLSAWLDGESGDDEAAVRAHLAACAACQRTVDAYRRLSVRLREVAAGEPVPSAAARRGRPRTEVLRAEVSRRRAGTRARRFAAAAVALAALSWATVALGDGRTAGARLLLDAGGLPPPEQRLLADAPPTAAEWLVIVLAGGTPR